MPIVSTQNDSIRVLGRGRPVASLPHPGLETAAPPLLPVTY